MGWAASLFSTLVEVWGKRGSPAIENLDPAKLDLEQLEGYFSRYGGERFSGSTGNIAGLGYSALAADAVPREADLALMDDFAACGIEKAEDIVDLFAQPIYFGCEADDKLTGVACSGKALPFGAKLKPVFGSDIGHWDVPNMNEVLGEAYEAGRGRVARRGRLPRLHLRQRGPAAWRHESEVLRRHGRRRRGTGDSRAVNIDDRLRAVRSSRRRGCALERARPRLRDPLGGSIASPAAWRGIARCHRARESPVRRRGLPARCKESRVERPTIRNEPALTSESDGGT